MDNIVVDSHYIIGGSHDYCQDYAWSGFIGNTRIPFAIVSDGCSGAKDSDFGARLLVNMVKGFVISKGFELSSMSEEVLYSKMTEYLGINIKYAMGIIGIHNEVFCATIRAIWVMDNKLYEFSWGDGVTIFDESVYYENPDPGDECYKVLTTTKYPYFKHNDSKVEIPYYFVESTIYGKKEMWMNSVKDNTIYSDGVPMSAEEYISDFNNFVKITDLIPGLRHVFIVITDGYDTFTHKNGNEYNGGNILEGMISLKNGKVPVKKRMVMVKREVELCGDVQHYDDFACAAIIIDNRQVKNE